MRELIITGRPWATLDHSTKTVFFKVPAIDKEDYLAIANAEEDLDSEAFNEKVEENAERFICFTRTVEESKEINNVINKDPLFLSALVDFLKGISFTVEKTVLFPSHMTEELKELQKKVNRFGRIVTGTEKDTVFVEELYD